MWEKCMQATQSLSLLFLAIACEFMIISNKKFKWKNKYKKTPDRPPPRLHWALCNLCVTLMYEMLAMVWMDEIGLWVLLDCFAYGNREDRYRYIDV